MEAKPLISHFDELRKSIIRIVIFFLLCAVIGLLFSQFIMSHIIDNLSLQNVELVSLTPLEFVYAQIKIAVVFALVFSLPLILFESIIFIKPGARKNELAALKYFLPGFILLFIIGSSFGYFIFLKTALFFLSRLSFRAGISNMWSIYNLISFSLLVCFGLGAIFEMPIIMLILKKMNIINAKWIAGKRPYVYISVFAVAAILTPPDIITQIMVALPIIVLYEITMLFM